MQSRNNINFLDYSSLIGNLLCKCSLAVLLKVDLKVACNYLLFNATLTHLSGSHSQLVNFQNHAFVLNHPVFNHFS